MFLLGILGRAFRGIPSAAAAAAYLAATIAHSSDCRLRVLSGLWIVTECAYELGGPAHSFEKALGKGPALHPGMTMDLSELEQLTEQVIGCAIAVHDELGPGLLESVYTECLMIELAANQLRVERERHVPIVYRGQTIRGRLRIDLLVEDQVIVEVKSAERSNPVFMAQLVTYLKLTGMPAGLLMNFNLSTLKAGLKRASHPDVYALKRKERQSDRP